MGTLGPNAGGTFANSAAIGSTAWVTPSNAAASDNVYTSTTSLGISQVTNYLKVTNFGFAVPTTASILGISVSIERQDNSFATIHDSVVSLVVGGSVTGNNKADTVTTWIAGSDTVITYGSSSDTWGLALGAADVNGSTFGMVIAVSGGAVGGIPSVDFVSITVEYLPAVRFAGLKPQFAVGTMSKSDNGSIRPRQFTPGLAR